MANAQHSPLIPAGGEVDLELDDTRNRQSLDEGRQAPILVLSRDAKLIETIIKAAPRGVPVMHAPDLDQAAGKLSESRPGVLVADTASTADVTSMVAQLTQHFPELVVVVAGRREDSGALMQLTAAGRIFRFLLTPLSHGQTRLALEAAVTHHLDVAATGERHGTAGTDGTGGRNRKNYLVTYGALAAGLLLLIGGIWFGVGRFTRAPEAPTTIAASAQVPDRLPDRPDPVQAEIALAQEAFAQGKYYEPSGESALDLYLSALALDPTSEAAKAGVRTVADKVLERAERALTAERLEEAVFSIERARNIDPTHPRLSFLDTQIARERERLKLTQAQEIGIRIRTLVAQANDRMHAGYLLTPSGGSAREALLEARRLDPTDPNVQQSIREFGGILIEKAHNTLAAGKPEEAQLFASAARQLGAAGAALTAVERSLAETSRAAGARASAARQLDAAIAAMIVDIRERIGAGKLIEPAGDSARDHLGKLVAAAPGRPEIEELARTLSTRLVDSSRRAMTAKAFDRSTQLLTAAREIGGRYNDVIIAQMERELAAAHEAYAQETSIVSVTSLTRTRTVDPIYPESALKRGIEGWIELTFTVTPNGSVNDIEVRNASPAGVFDDAAIRAVRSWRFVPVTHNGEKIAQRAMVRLRFALPGRD
ncbi:hypothetical protein ACG33_14270 [Steroidobacter denitrificans]|uniref:Protein TonB n=1 Tax=Steroidobacter denitrificans TaxID=465721 RepID=A0A127FED9_STEDE|nr:energy transducer TonB [Steroidobacter denitrificans]AMN48241.1 hypothetical protein ACG33_14270 [Steroidobacter denitrificans]